jgi:hypothetical protein
MYFVMALQFNMNIKLIFYESLSLYHKLPYITIYEKCSAVEKNLILF